MSRKKAKSVCIGNNFEDASREVGFVRIKTNEKCLSERQAQVSDLNHAEIREEDSALPLNGKFQSTCLNFRRYALKETKDKTPEDVLAFYEDVSNRISLGNYDPQSFCLGRDGEADEIDCNKAYIKYVVDTHDTPCVQDGKAW